MQFQFSTEQKDALTEIINIGVGRAGAMLSDLVEQRIELRVPSVQMCDLSEIGSVLGSRGEMLDTSIFQDFDGAVSGRTILAFPRESGLRLGQILGELGQTPDELDVDLIGILTEVGNILINGVMGSISNMFESTLAYTVPELSADVCLTELARHPQAEKTQQTVIYSDAHFTVSGTQIQGSLLLIFNLPEIEHALQSLLQTA